MRLLISNPHLSAAKVPPTPLSPNHSPTPASLVRFCHCFSEFIFFSGYKAGSGFYSIDFVGYLYRRKRKKKRCTVSCAFESSSRWHFVDWKKWNILDPLEAGRLTCLKYFAFCRVEDFLLVFICFYSTYLYLSAILKSTPAFYRCETHDPSIKTFLLA